MGKTADENTPGMAEDTTSTRSAYFQTTGSSTAIQVSEASLQLAQQVLQKTSDENTPIVEGPTNAMSVSFQTAGSSTAKHV